MQSIFKMQLSSSAYRNLATVADQLQIKQHSRVVAVQLASVRPIVDRVLRTDDVRGPLKVVLAIVVHFAQNRMTLAE